jgi:hypothetical protein
LTGRGAWGIIVFLQMPDFTVGATVFAQKILFVRVFYFFPTSLHMTAK